MAKRELGEIGVGSLVRMEDELATLRNENTDLKEELNSRQERLTPSTDLIDDPSMIQKAMDLEMKLEMALAKIEQMEGQQLTPNDSNVDLLERELAQANTTIDDLNTQIENMISRQAEAELELAMLENAKPTATSEAITSEEKALFIEEINSLRDELKSAKEEYAENSARSPEMSELQNELRQAVAESFELQMELEQTQDRLKKFEEIAALDSNQETIKRLPDRLILHRKKLSLESMNSLKPLKILNYSELRRKIW